MKCGHMKGCTEDAVMRVEVTQFGFTVSYDVFSRGGVAYCPRHGDHMLTLLTAQATKTLY